MTEDKGVPYAKEKNEKSDRANARNSKKNEKKSYASRTQPEKQKENSAEKE